MKKKVTHLSNLLHVSIVMACHFKPIAFRVKDSKHVQFVFDEEAHQVLLEPGDRALLISELLRTYEQVREMQRQAAQDHFDKQAKMFLKIDSKQ